MTDNDITTSFLNQINFLYLLSSLWWIQFVSILLVLANMVLLKMAVLSAQKPLIHLEEKMEQKALRLSNGKSCCG